MLCTNTHVTQFLPYLLVVPFLKKKYIYISILLRVSLNRKQSNQSQRALFYMKEVLNTAGGGPTRHREKILHDSSLKEGSMVTSRVK